MKDLSAALLTAPPAMQRRQGFTNGAEDWQSFRFGDLAIVAVKLTEPGPLILELSSPEPQATERGLSKYQARLECSLHKWYGREVRLKMRDSA